jgi:hypothetical protein
MGWFSKKKKNSAPSLSATNTSVPIAQASITVPAGSHANIFFGQSYSMPAPHFIRQPPFELMHELEATLSKIVSPDQSHLDKAENLAVQLQSLDFDGYDESTVSEIFALVEKFNVMRDSAQFKAIRGDLCTVKALLQLGSIAEVEEAIQDLKINLETLLESEFILKESAGFFLAEMEQDLNTRKTIHSRLSESSLGKVPEVSEAIQAPLHEDISQLPPIQQPEQPPQPIQDELLPSATPFDADFSEFNFFDSSPPPIPEIIPDHDVPADLPSVPDLPNNIPESFTPPPPAHPVSSPNTRQTPLEVYKIYSDTSDIASLQSSSSSSSSSSSASIESSQNSFHTRKLSKDSLEDEETADFSFHLISSNLFSAELTIAVLGKDVDSLQILLSDEGNIEKLNNLELIEKAKNILLSFNEDSTKATNHRNSIVSLNIFREWREFNQYALRLSRICLSLTVKKDCVASRDFFEYWKRSLVEMNFIARLEVNRNSRRIRKSFEIFQQQAVKQRAKKQQQEQLQQKLSVEVSPPLVPESPKIEIQTEGKNMIYTNHVSSGKTETSAEVPILAQIVGLELPAENLPVPSPRTWLDEEETKWLIFTAAHKKV